MVTEKTIRQLIQKNDNPKISLSFPTHKVGDDRQQNPIRFKNLISKAAEQLKTAGKRDDEIEKILNPAKELLGQPLFWSNMELGMVVYITPDYFDVFKIPFDVREMAYVNDHFLITPLLPMLSTNGTYAVMAVSQHKVRLLRCTRTSIVDITPESIPLSLDTYLEEKPEPHIQFHTGSRDGDGVMFFGHGSTEEDRKEVTEQFFRDVEKGITETLNKFNDPLVLAGLKANTSLYRRINNYSRIVDDAIDQNADSLTDANLRDKGWDNIRNFFLSDLYKSLDAYRESSADLISRDPSEIIISTIMGKSAAIFISKDLVRWGKYDEQQHKVQYKHAKENGDVDLMNWVSIKGLETGSRVYVLPKNEMPDHSDVAALFRF